VFWMSEVLNQSGHLCLVDHFDANEGPGRERRLKLDYNLSLAQEHGGAGRTVEVTCSCQCEIVLLDARHGIGKR